MFRGVRGGADAPFWQGWSLGYILGWSPWNKPMGSGQTSLLGIPLEASLQYGDFLGGIFTIPNVLFFFPIRCRMSSSVLRFLFVA